MLRSRASGQTAATRSRGGPSVWRSDRFSADAIATLLCLKDMQPGLHAAPI